jgi:hypothetical protein
MLLASNIGFHIEKSLSEALNALNCRCPQNLPSSPATLAFRTPQLPPLLQWAVPEDVHEVDAPELAASRCAEMAARTLVAVGSAAAVRNCRQQSIETAKDKKSDAQGLFTVLCDSHRTAAAAAGHLLTETSCQ